MASCGALSVTSQGEAGPDDRGVAGGEEFQLMHWSEVVFPGVIHALNCAAAQLSFVDAHSVSLSYCDCAGITLDKRMLRVLA